MHQSIFLTRHGSWLERPIAEIALRKLQRETQAFWIGEKLAMHALAPEPRTGFCQRFYVALSCLTKRNGKEVKANERNPNQADTSLSTNRRRKISYCTCDMHCACGMSHVWETSVLIHQWEGWQWWLWHILNMAGGHVVFFFWFMNNGNYVYGN